ncbi:MAG: translation initiation factor IF-3 [Clostridia bacterium]|nr:translation initiation factor IF-3 [Clostridia bacterium]
MMNEEIRDREVRVIDQNGEQLGVLPIRKALELAEEAELDLVKIVPTAKPPVCKLMDYDKYRYEQAKKEREKDVGNGSCRFDYRMGSRLLPSSGG